MIIRSFPAAILMMLASALVAAHSDTQSGDTAKSGASDSPIRFAYQAIEFKLDSNESAEHHAPETMAGGVAVFDYNNDGKLDIFFTNGADLKTLKKDSPKYYNRLFENDGKGHFADVTEKAGLKGTGYDTGVAIADYDNDGYEDIFLAGVYRNTLYHNNGDGTFTDVTAKAGLKKPDPEYGPLWSVGAAWIDVNNDGLLDLVVINYLKWDFSTEPVCAGFGHNDYCHPKMYKPTPNQLFINKGDGTFRDASVEAGFRAHPGKGMGVAAADSQLTGRMDLIVPNDKLMNSFYRNKGNGKFEEVAFEENVALREDGVYISGMGADFRDFDGDGWPDIVMTGLRNETYELFRNNGKGGFDDASASSGLLALSREWSGWSCGFADFDNDGRLDIFVACGGVEMNEPQVNRVLQNAGTKLVDVSSRAGEDFQVARVHRGAAFADFDNDGRIDVAVTSINGPVELWMNRSPTQHWLQLKLEGTRSNASALGAQIVCRGSQRTQTCLVSNSVGYGCSSDSRVHFGLGQERTVSLEIRWPSGTVQQMEDVKCDQRLSIQEPSPKP